MNFTKMHGCGNDYVYINGITETILQEEKPKLVKYFSDRHFGIGGDGVIFINASTQADFEMEMFNADGTRAEMCGNGIRCVAKYVYDKGLTTNKELSIISAGQVKYVELTVNSENKVDTVKVNMGAPILIPNQIPVILSGEMIIAYPVRVLAEEYKITCVSMGNHHAIVFMDEVLSLELEKIGPSFENHILFHNRINTEFVEVIDRKTVIMRVWERGTGETLACGTGCCATAVACILNGLTEDKITVKLLGGEISIEWDRDKNIIYMTGPAQIVFEGQIDERRILNV